VWGTGQPYHAENRGYNLASFAENEAIIYQLKKWPHFTWDHLRLAEPLARVHHEPGRPLGRMEGLGKW
jgi:Domain of unknown function (DUF4172)